jgi:hypothetical protein
VGDVSKCAERSSRINVGRLVVIEEARDSGIAKRAIRSRLIDLYPTMLRRNLFPRSCKATAIGIGTNGVMHTSRNVDRIFHVLCEVIVLLDGDAP